jgi:hypothetical protein
MVLRTRTDTSKEIEILVLGAVALGRDGQISSLVCPV